MRQARHHVRRRVLTGSLLAFLAGGQALWAQGRETPLPTPDSLIDAAQAAAIAGEPLVLLVSLPGCPYCELLRRNYLSPMRRSEQLHAWQVQVNEHKRNLVGFDGVETTAGAYTDRMQAKFTPTVLFLGPNGEELSPRMVGVASADFLGSVLDGHLTQAREALRNQRRKP